MKFSVDKDALSKAMSVVVRAVPNKSPMPVLTNVLLTVRKKDDGAGEVELAGFNGEMSITTTIDADVRVEGGITIPARKMLELVNFNKSGPVDFELDKKNDNLTFTSFRNKNTLAGIDAGNFPQTYIVQNSIDVVSIPAGIFRTAINQTAIAAATSDARPILTGIQLVVREGGMRLSAADSFRVAVKVIGLPSGVVANAFSGVVAARSLLEFARIIPDDDSEVQIKVNSNQTQVILVWGNTVVTTQMIEGNYPPVSNFIPKTHNTSIVLDKTELLMAIRQMAVYLSDETSNASGNGKSSVRFIINGFEGEDTGILRVTSNQTGIGTGFSDIETSHDGADNKTALNLGYILNVLAVMETNQVVIKMKDQQTPCVFTPLDDASYTYVIMPVLINSELDDEPVVTPTRAAATADAPVQVSPEPAGDAEEERETVGAGNFQDPNDIGF